MAKADRFSEDLGDGFFLDPDTGEVWDATSDTLIMDAEGNSPTAAQDMADASSSSGLSAAVPALMSGALLYSMMPEGAKDTLPAATPAAASLSAPEAPNLISAQYGAANPSLSSTGGFAGSNSFMNTLGASSPEQIMTPVGNTFANMGTQAASTIPTTGWGSSALWAPAGSDAAALGGNIASGLEYVGMAPETAATAGGVMGNALPVIGGALGAYGLWNQLKNPGTRTGTGGQALQGAMSGAALGGGIGAFTGPGGTLIGSGVGALAGGLGGAISSLTGSTRGQATKERDYYRDVLQADPGDGSSPILDSNYKFTLPSGASYDWGSDVNNIGNEFTDYVDGPEETRKLPWAIGQDTESRQASGALDPLGWLMGQGNENLSVSSTGFLTRTAKNKGDVRTNVRDSYNKLGLDHDTAYGMVTLMFQDGKIDASKRDQLYNTLDKTYGVGAYQGLGAYWDRQNEDAVDKVGSSDSSTDTTTTSDSSDTAKKIGNAVGNSIPKLGTTKVGTTEGGTSNTVNKLINIANEGNKSRMWVSSNGEEVPNVRKTNIYHPNQETMIPGKAIRNIWGRTIG